VPIFEISLKDYILL